MTAIRIALDRLVSHYTMKIHKDILTARIACENYVRERFELQERKGVTEECEDSCASVHIKAKYYDKQGSVKTYYFE